MTRLGAVWLAVFSLAFYVCGGLCIFKTRALVEMSQKNYARSSRVVQDLADTVTKKPWPPFLIRAAGVFIWAWALAIDYLALFRGWH